MHTCMWNRKGNYLFFPIGIVCLLTKGLLMGVRNLSCDLEQSEGFSPRRVAEVTRQAGMTLKTNIQFLTPCGLCRRVLHFIMVLLSILYQIMFFCHSEFISESCIL